MRIAAIIPVHNRRVTTLKCLEQLKTKVATDGATLQIIVVDDGSTDDTSEAIEKVYPDVTILKGDGNLWWTGAINKGVEYALSQDCDYVLTLNDDLELDEHFLTELLNVARQYPAALLSSIKSRVNDSGQRQVLTAGFKIVGVLRQITALHAGEDLTPSIIGTLECDMLTGASLLIPKEVFRKIGVFNEKTFPHNWGDLEFTRRASLSGFQCLTVTSSSVYTEANQNYLLPYLINSSRLDYLKNLFNSTKYFYGFSALWRASFMHRPPLIGSIVFIRGALGTLQRLMFKLLLPNMVLRRVLNYKVRRG